jgi:5-methylcytosine-specific restriction enzyme A
VGLLLVRWLCILGINGMKIIVVILMPSKPLKPCSKVGCRELSTTKYCTNHTVQHTYDRSSNDKQYDKTKRNQKSKAFYKSIEWQKVRTAALIRDRYLCQHCLKKKQITKAYIVDHITPVLVDWEQRLNINNLQSLCNPCHNSKTNDDKKIFKGVGGI